MNIKELLVQSASKVSPLSPVVSTEQAAAMMGELLAVILQKVDAPVKQGYATRSQLSRYFGYEHPKSFNMQLNGLLAYHGKNIRRFAPTYVNGRGEYSHGTERFCIEDIEKLLLDHSGKVIKKGGF